MKWRTSVPELDHFKYRMLLFPEVIGCSERDTHTWFTRYTPCAEEGERRGATRPPGHIPSHTLFAHTLDYTHFTHHYLAPRKLVGRGKPLSTLTPVVRNDLAG